MKALRALALGTILALSFSLASQAQTTTAAADPNQPATQAEDNAAQQPATNPDQKAAPASSDQQSTPAAEDDPNVCGAACS
jgi:hypothetical protein